MRQVRLPLEAVLAAYLLAWIPYIALTKGLSSLPQPQTGRPLTGLEMLPASLLILWALTYAFLGISGWKASATQIRIGNVVLPRPRAWTGLAGLGSALLLVAVPLSFTIKGVSIPFMQLLMRGDVLLIAPLVDLVTGRRVRWWSWTALVLVGLGMAATVRYSGAVRLPLIAIIAIALYCLGYLVRLLAMSRLAKTGEAGALKGYYFEEQLLATPLAITGVALIGLLGRGTQAEQIRWGFASVWASPALPLLALIAALACLQSVLGAAILLSPQENTLCVALERAGSVLGGVAAAFWLRQFYAQPAPTPAELAGSSLLILAIALLSIAPRVVHALRGPVSRR